MPSKKKRSPKTAPRKTRSEDVDVLPLAAEPRDLVRALLRLQRQWEGLAVAGELRWRAPAEHAATVISALVHALHVDRRDTVLRDLSRGARGALKAERASGAPRRHLHLTYNVHERGEPGALAAVLRAEIASMLEKTRSREETIRTALLLWLEMTGGSLNIDEAAFSKKVFHFKKKGRQHDDLSRAIVRALFAAASLSDPFNAEDVAAHRAKRVVTSRRSNPKM